MEWRVEILSVLLKKTDLFNSNKLKIINKIKQ